MNNKAANFITYELYLKHIMQLNAFDAIVFLKRELNNTYTVQLVNEKAADLFHEINGKAVLAEEYFSPYYWGQLLPMLKSPSRDVQILQYKQLKNEEPTLLAVNVLPIELEDIHYYSIFFRRTSKNNSIVQEDSKEVAKHLYFLEQYIDPVLSLDLNGTIIYTNIAATNKLKEKKKTVLGKNIKDLVADHYKDDFNILFEKTLAGAASGMPKCEFNEKFFQSGPFYLKVFPTYWNGEIIGGHIILKEAASFFSDNEAFYYLSLRDELTGLWNRRALKEHWKSEVSNLTSEESNIAALLVDVDRFKKFNEALGESKGDELIIGLCKRLKTICHDNSRLYRYGGDEFIFVIKDHTPEQLKQFASTIINILKKPFVFDDQDYFVTVSIGIAIAPTDGTKLETIIRKADQAVFHVKEHGRSNYKFYTEDLGYAFPNEALMEAHLRRAIELNELSIHLQPQMDLITKRIDSFEALLRWNNPKFGFVSPAQFIPIAEASGLIIEIGDWILEQVCQYQAEWRKKGYRPVRIAVNISPKQFRQENFARKIEAILNKYDVSPNYLEVEITESSMTNMEDTFSTLTELKRLGVYVSVDDFGTGYSSLSYLKRYPIDIIKIDQSFIADIEKDHKNEAIIKAILLLSHNLGLEVVAEGVEEQFQEDFLKEYRCQKVQGYYYNKPLPVDDMVNQYLIN